MARPRKQDADKRTRVVSFRVTDEEYAQLEAKASAARPKLAPGDYARLCALRGRVEVVNAPPVLSPKEFLELNRIGVNLNQLMPEFHETKRLPAGLETTIALLNAFLTKAMRLESFDEREDISARRIAG